MDRLLSTLSTRAVQRKNKYRIYFSGVENTVFIFGLENTVFIFGLENTVFIFRAWKIQYLFSGWKIPELFGQLRNIPVPELSIYYGNHTNAEFAG